MNLRKGEVEVKFDNEKRSLKFGTCTFKDLEDLLGGDLDMKQFAKELAIRLKKPSGLIFIIWSGLKNAEIMQKGSSELTEFQVSIMCDGIEKGGLDKITNCLMESRFMGFEISDTQQNGGVVAKKKK